MLFTQGQWPNSVLVATIMAITIVGIALEQRIAVKVPPEFQVLAIVFVFSALFLGEVHEFYERIWWWDIGLHASSGVLLGIFGFLLVYVLNENRRVEVNMSSFFVALFAFVFSVAVGALWEMLEFGADQLLGTQMQKPSFGDPAGLVDTMWDLIVDTLGALVVAVFGWWRSVHSRRLQKLQPRGTKVAR